MIDDEHHEALGAMIHAMKPRDYHREIADERQVEKLREALIECKEWIGGDEAFATYFPEEWSALMNRIDAALPAMENKDG